MKNALHFYKMHGLGNDFVVMPQADLSINQIKYICDRHLGIGCDQLVVYRDFLNPSVKFYNNDGSYSEMCGNGLRCLAALLMTLQGKDDVCIQTDAGDRWCKKVDAGLIQVEMGKPILDNSSNLKLDLGRGYYASVGNPHIVFFMDAIDLNLLSEHGPNSATNDQFANGCNVHFAVIKGPGIIEAAHFERGSGMTLACASGATAIYAIAKSLGLIHEKCKISMPGGEVTLETRTEDGMLLLTGPYCNVFEGSIILP